MQWQLVTTSSEETERLGQLLGEQLKGGDLLELRADLGGGKTTFVRGLVRGLGSKDPVSSPSFTLKNIYKAKISEIHHFDFYRLNEPGILADQLEESLNDKNVVTVVEWSDIVQDVLPKERITVEFKPVSTNQDERQVVITYTESKTEIIKRLETDWANLKP